MACWVVGRAARDDFVSECVCEKSAEIERETCKTGKFSCMKGDTKESVFKRPGHSPGVSTSAKDSPLKLWAGFLAADEYALF